MEKIDFEKLKKTISCEKQLDKMIEECAELIVTTQHHKQKRADQEKLIEEMIDVKILLTQMEELYFVTQKKSFSDWWDKKVKRLNKNMDEYGDVW